MVRFLPILALTLAVYAPLPGVGTALAQTAQQRESGVSPRTLERRAKNAAPEQKAELLRLAAQRWVARGERRRAILALDEAILARPDDARLWRQRARLYAAAGANRTAIYDVSRAIEIDANSLASYRLRATLWRRLGAHDLAAADLTRAAGDQNVAQTPASTAESAQDVAQVGPHPDAPDTRANSTTPAPTPQAVAAPRSLLPSAEALAADFIPGERSTAAVRPARAALLEHPALDDVKIAAGRKHAAPGPEPEQFASSQPLFPPPGTRDGLPAAPDPLDAHRRQMEAAAIVQRRIEAGEAMTTAMDTTPASGLPDPNFRASTAPLPRIYRGMQSPPQFTAKVVVVRNQTTVAGIGGPHLPVRKAVPAARQAKQAAAAMPNPMMAALPRAQGRLPATPASFDATPADPMIEHGTAVPVVLVERGKLR